MSTLYQWWPPETVNAVLGLLTGVAVTWLVLFVRYSWKLREVAQTAGASALRASRRVLKGQAAEQLAPLTDGFPYLPSDARFLGSPFDYLIFDGLSDDDGDGEVEIVFLEIKTGRAKLSARETKIKRAVEAGRVRWEELRLASS